MLEAEARGLPETHQLRGVAQLLRALLRIDPTEAAGRVNAAHATGTRRTITGQPVRAVLPTLAAAQAEGGISERQAQLIRVTIDKLPEQVRDEHGEQIEAELVGHAYRFDPIPLAKLAERIRYCYDPDGQLADVAYRDKHRDLTVRQRVDGSSTLTGECTSELTELLLTNFDALAKPRPEQRGLKDPRNRRAAPPRRPARRPQAQPSCRAAPNDRWRDSHRRHDDDPGGVRDASWVGDD